ncbi:hypothetical protein [Flavobacterium sp. ACN6]|nr:hypothetical protein [Flavobacterium sp. ACN6]
MKTFKRKEKSKIDQAQQSFKIKNRIINTMVFSIVSFIAILLICKIA